MLTHSSLQLRFVQSTRWALSLIVMPLLLILMSPKHVLSASFDCSKASTQNEKLICQDPWLSKLDEDYSRLYREARSLTQNNPSINDRIKRSARSLLTQREQKCKDRSCLLKWYQTGRIWFTGEIRRFNPEALTKNLTPELLYKRLNLRSFPSMIGQHVKYHCETYLNEYFPVSDVRMDSKTLLIESDSSIWKIDIVNDTTVNIENRKTDGTYNTTLTRNVHYDPGAQDIRVIVPQTDGGETFLIKRREACEPLRNNAETVSNIQPFMDLADKELERLSIGEFLLANVNSTTTFPVYNAPNGEVIGNVFYTHKYRGKDYATPRGGVTFRNPEKTVPYRFMLRSTEVNSLLIFDRRDNWFNLSPNPDLPMWADDVILGQKNYENYRTRVQVMLQGSHIKVRSAHRLRAQPSTTAPIIDVLQRVDTEQIRPISVDGDWMQVQVVTPSPGQLSIEKVLSDSRYSVTAGWLKWTNSDNKAYVDVVY